MALRTHTGITCRPSGRLSSFSPEGRGDVGRPSGKPRVVSVVGYYSLTRDGRAGLTAGRQSNAVHTGLFDGSSHRPAANAGPENRQVIPAEAAGIFFAGAATGRPDKERSRRGI